MCANCYIDFYSTSRFLIILKSLGSLRMPYFSCNEWYEYQALSAITNYETFLRKSSQNLLSSSMGCVCLHTQANYYLNHLSKGDLFSKDI